jgi:MFS family permease
LPRAGKLYDRLGARPLLATGTLIGAAGFAVFALLAFPNQSYAWMVPGFVLAGLGVGLIQVRISPMQ